MTPEERADAVAVVVYGIYRHAPMDERAYLALRQSIADAIGRATEEEREAVARFLLSESSGKGSIHEALARAVRDGEHLR